MKKLLFLFTICSFLAFSCNKETPTANVTFEVRETSPATPTFTVEYTADKSGGTHQGGTASSAYSSGSIELLQGQYVQLKTSCSDPTYELHLYIYVNGDLWQTAVMSNPTPSKTLDGYVPAD